MTNNTKQATSNTTNNKNKRGLEDSMFFYNASDDVDLSSLSFINKDSNGHPYDILINKIMPRPLSSCSR